MSAAPTAAKRRVARAVQRRAPLDAFADAPHARPRPHAARSLAISPDVVLALLGVAATAAAVALPSLAPLVVLLALAVCAGPLAKKAQQTTALLTLLGGAAGFVIDGAAAAAFVACSVFSFSFLPRGLLHLALRAAQKKEQARADAEVLRLVDDARLFRRLGNAEDGLLDDVACAVGQRDRLYRVLRLAERAVKDTATVSLYAVDDAGASLVLVEQLVKTEAQNHPRLALGGRGVGAAGLLGLCLQRRAPLRVVDGEGHAVRAHRQSGAPPLSALCVPLLARGGSVRGVLVLDRNSATAFTADDEAFALALGEELLEGLAGEQVLKDLDNERRRAARVSAATRALAGVVRGPDVVEAAAKSLAGLCSSCAVVDAEGHVLFTSGPLGGLQSGTIAGDSFAGRALAERATFPHTPLAQAQRRHVLHADDGVDVSSFCDLRVVPLLAHGEARGVIVVAGDRFSSPSSGLDAVCAVADVVALALAAARSFDAVERQATRDGLTGVWNRRALDQRLDEAVARARRSGQPLCVLLTDVDHFKSVNDAWGHATGDEVLKGVARALEQQARTTDIVGRLGGEEFVVVCEGADVEGACAVAERMRLAIKALSFDTAKGPLSVTSSFGVALLLPGEGGHEVLERADQQLYRAKQGGRDRTAADRSAEHSSQRC